MADESSVSFCIPQYNRTSFLLRSLERLRAQTDIDFEVCISDGGSTDGRGNEITRFLQSSGIRHKYQTQEERVPYDGNLRAAIALASGRYCFLLGNDDMLATCTTLKQIKEIVAEHDFPEVVVTNYHELSTGRDYRRVSRTAVIGSGVEAAIANFRNYSFVSGILIDRHLAHAQATDKWDGSEMYQTFLATRIVAQGGRLLGIADTIILKDIQIRGEYVDSYAHQARMHKVSIEERSLPLAQLGRAVLDGLSPYLGKGDINRATRRVFRQLLLFTYPPWLVEYRRIQSWRYAVGVALGMRPRNILRGLLINRMTKAYIRTLYVAVTLAGLVFPIRLFERLKPRLHAFAKRR